MAQVAQRAGGGDGATPRTDSASSADDAAHAGERLFVGAMSGTSADGVDAALIAVTGRGVAMSCRLLDHLHVPYHSALKQDIFAIREAGAAELRALARLAREISLAYIAAVNQLLEK